MHDQASAIQSSHNLKTCTRSTSTSKSMEQMKLTSPRPTTQAPRRKPLDSTRRRTNPACASSLSPESCYVWGLGFRLSALGCTFATGSLSIFRTRINPFPSPELKHKHTDSPPSGEHRRALRPRTSFLNKHGTECHASQPKSILQSRSMQQRGFVSDSVAVVLLTKLSNSSAGPAKYTQQAPNQLRQVKDMLQDNNVTAL